MTVLWFVAVSLAFWGLMAGAFWAVLFAHGHREAAFVCGGVK